MRVMVIVPNQTSSSAQSELPFVRLQTRSIPRRAPRATLARVTGWTKVVPFEPVVNIACDTHIVPSRV